MIYIGSKATGTTAEGTHVTGVVTYIGDEHVGIWSGMYEYTVRRNTVTKAN